MVECGSVLSRVGSLMHSHFTQLLTDSRSLNQTSAYVPLVLR